MTILFKHNSDSGQILSNGEDIPSFKLDKSETKLIPNYRSFIGLEGRLVLLNPLGMTDREGNKVLRKFIGVISRESFGYHAHGSEFLQLDKGNQRILWENYRPLIKKISYDLSCIGYSPRLIMPKRPDIEEALRILTQGHIELVRFMQPRPRREF